MILNAKTTYRDNFNALCSVFFKRFKKSVIRVNYRMMTMGLSKRNQNLSVGYLQFGGCKYISFYRLKSHAMIYSMFRDILIFERNFRLEKDVKLESLKILYY